MSDTLAVRVALPNDAFAFAKIYAPIVAETPISFEDVPPSPEEMRRRIVTTLERYPWLAALCDERVAGYAYAGKHRERACYRWSVDVSVYVAPRYHRRGVARALYTKLLEILQQQRFRHAYAGVGLPNDASVALHRALGFEDIGIYRRVGWKFDRWHDVMWLGRAVGADVDDATTPPEPISFSTLTPRMLGEER